MLSKRLHVDAPASDPELGGTGAAEPVVLDAASLDKLRQLDPTGKGKLIQKVASAFDGSVARLLSQLDDAYRSSDLIEVHRVAHTLKSSSQSVGALKLSKICAEIESMTRLGNSVGLDERLTDMKTELVKVQAALRSLAASES